MKFVDVRSASLYLLQESVNKIMDDEFRIDVKESIRVELVDEVYTDIVRKIIAECDNCFEGKKK